MTQQWYDFLNLITLQWCIISESFRNLFTVKALTAMVAYGEEEMPRSIIICSHTMIAET